MMGLLLGYLAVFVFAVASLVALVLLTACLIKAALILFAAGLLCATVIAAVATLTFLGKESHEYHFSTMIVLTALALLLAGAGQFVAALRSPRTYAAALACAAGSIVLLAAPLLGCDVGTLIPGVRHLDTAGPVPLALPSLLLAVAGLMIAVLPAFHSRWPKPASPEEDRGPT
jgi:hypothetical protein